MRDIKLLGTIMAAALVVAACGGTTTPGPGAATTPGAPAATQAAGELPKPEVTTLRIGISTPNEPVQFAQKLADSLGIYQKYGFTSVTVTGFEGDGRALQALVAGQLDMFVGGSSATLNSVVSDTPLKLVSMNSTVLTDGLWCGPTIKAPADLRGKGVAISTFGGTSHGAALLLLQGVGLDDKTATIQEVGNQGTRIAALRGGSVACAVVDMAQESAMKAAGMNLLFNLATSKLQWGRSGFMAKVDFIQKNPNTVLVATAAVLEAQNSMWTAPEAAAKHFAAFAQIKEEDALKSITAFQGYGSRSMTFTDAALEAPKRVLAAANPAIANVDVKKAYDLSFLKKLQDIGFYKKINAPTE